MEPIIANTICVAARATTTGGKPAKKKPIVVPIDTNTAVRGDMNIAIKIATWLASVNVVKPSGIFIGDTIGIKIPTAHNSAAIVMPYMRFFASSMSFSLSGILSIIAHIG